MLQTMSRNFKQGKSDILPCESIGEFQRIDKGKIVCLTLECVGGCAGVLGCNKYLNCTNFVFEADFHSADQW